MKRSSRFLTAVAVGLALAPVCGRAETVNDLSLKQFGKVVTNPTILDALQHAVKPLTPEIRKKALECYRSNDCNTGTGGKLTVAYADGFGENVWRKVTKMEFILQALSYPQIGHIEYRDARGDVSKAISDMNSYIAQGVNVIVIYPDAGAAMLPVVQEATAAGIKVVLHNGPAIGTAGKDYLTNVREDICQLGNALVDSIKQGNPEAKRIVELGGTPGNTLSSTWQACAAKQAKKDGLTILGKYDTNWTQEGTFKAVSAALAQFGKIDGWAYEYADGFRGAVRAYEAAHKPLDMVAALRTDEQGLFCDWKKANNPNFKIYYSSAFNISTRIALTAAMESLDGKSIPAWIQLPFKMKPVKQGLCNPDLPMETSVTTTLDDQMLKAMFPK
ncbi:substrate-binding domain-containing protein [Solirhodobacter olei]|uniref:substrate-binding domain-containing protein n=1 Tax=Solirhodobacter olei TaxID=2493082 RepID=UPI000FD816C7|nr:substrate-binding domain-containing protein [Solirhodobacter olei]